MSRAVRHAQAGITLIEMLIVLAVIGVAAGATMLRFGDHGRTAQTEAIRLARHLTLGVDEALIEGRPLALQWDETGYTFRQMSAAQPNTEPEAWPVATSPVLGMRHDIGRPFVLALRDGVSRSPVIVPVSGAAPPVTFEITGSDPTWLVQFDGFTAFAELRANP